MTINVIPQTRDAWALPCAAPPFIIKGARHDDGGALWLHFHFPSSQARARAAGLGWWCWESRPCKARVALTPARRCARPGRRTRSRAPSSYRLALPGEDLKKKRVLLCLLRPGRGREIWSGRALLFVRPRALFPPPPPARPAPAAREINTSKCSSAPPCRAIRPCVREKEMPPRVSAASGWWKQIKGQETQTLQEGGEWSAAPGSADALEALQVVSNPPAGRPDCSRFPQAERERDPQKMGDWRENMSDPYEKKLAIKTQNIGERMHDGIHALLTSERAQWPLVLHF